MSLALPGPLRHAARNLASPVPLGGICLASIGSTFGVFIGRTSVTSAAIGAAIGLAILALVLGARRLLRTHAARRAGARFTETFEGILGGSEKDPEARGAADTELRRVLRGPERTRLLQDPWYLVLGVTGVGKTQVVRKSGLNVHWQRHHQSRGSDTPKDDAGTWSLDVWRADSAVFVDVAGRLTMPSQEDLRSEREWSDLAAALRDARPSRPLNGIVMLVSALSLIADSDEELDAKAESMRCRLESIRATLQMRLPVYLVVSKTDRIEGFQALFERLNAREREQILGWSFAGGPDSAVSWPEVEGGIQDVMRALIQRRTTMLAANRLADGEAPFLFPRQLRCVQERLKPYVTQVLRTCGVHGHMLRGVYFTSAEQVGEELSLEHAERTGARERDAAYRRRGEEAYFIRNLVEQKILVERDLGRATIDDGRLVIRRRTRAMAKAATILIPLVVLPAAIGGWTGLSEVSERQAVLGELSRDDPETRATARAAIAQHLDDPVRTPIFFAFAAAVDGSGAGVKQQQLLDALAIQVRRELASRLDTFAERVGRITEPGERYRRQPAVHAVWRAVDRIREGIEAPGDVALDEAFIALEEAMQQLDIGPGLRPGALGSEMAVVLRRDQEQADNMLEVVRTSLATAANAWPGALSGERDLLTRQGHADALGDELARLMAGDGDLRTIRERAAAVVHVSSQSDLQPSSVALPELGSLLGVASTGPVTFQPPMSMELAKWIQQLADHASVLDRSDSSNEQLLSASQGIAEDRVSIEQRETDKVLEATVKEWAAEIRGAAVARLDARLQEGVALEPSVARLQGVDVLIASLEALDAADRDHVEAAGEEEWLWWTDLADGGHGPLALLRADAREHGRGGRMLADFKADDRPESREIREAAAIGLQSVALETLGEALDALAADVGSPQEVPRSAPERASAAADWLHLIEGPLVAVSEALDHTHASEASTLHDHVFQAWQRGIIDRHEELRKTNLARVNALADRAEVLEASGRWLVAIHEWASAAGNGQDSERYPRPLEADDLTLARVAAGSGTTVRFRLEGPTTRPTEGITIASRRTPLDINGAEVDPVPGADGTSEPVTLFEPIAIMRSRSAVDLKETFHVGDLDRLRLLDLILAGRNHSVREGSVLHCSVQLTLVRSDGSSASVAAVLIVHGLDSVVLDALLARTPEHGGAP